MIKYCSGCGSKYELTEQSIMFRDKDSLDCDICGAVLIKWNGACMWTAKLLKKNNLNLVSEEEKHIKK